MTPEGVGAAQSPRALGVVQTRGVQPSPWWSLLVAFQKDR